MATTETTIAAESTPGRLARPLRDAVRLLVKGGLLVVATFALLFAIAVAVPEGNDYAEAARIQHAALTAPLTKKIVLVGGSNLAFGIDSPTIEAATGCPVANMGINGYLGVRFMLNQVEPNLRSGDVVVLAFEYDSFFKPVEGTPSDQFVVAKASPVTLAYFTLRQKLLMLAAVPYIAQQKVLRLMEDAYAGGIKGEIGEELALIQRIETVAGVTRNGDLTSHIGVEWPYGFENGLDATALPVDDQIIGLLQGFAERLEARGVHVVMSYTPVMRRYYDEHRASIDRLHALIEEAAPLAPPSPPSAYVYDEPLFFDTVYHLNAEGRALRTHRLIDDLRAALHHDAQCADGMATAQQTGVSE